MWDYIGKGLAILRSLEITPCNHAFLLSFYPPLKELSLVI